MAGIDTSYKLARRSVGRPTKMTQETVKKLEEAFAIGASDGEACFYADITRQTLTTYQNDNPEFLDRKNRLKERPVLLARQSVINGLANDPQLALKYLERKMKSEFSTKVEQETSITLVQPILGGDAKQIDNVHSNDLDT
jgi:hypothetical protein